MKLKINEVIFECDYVGLHDTIDNEEYRYTLTLRKECESPVHLGVNLNDYEVKRINEQIEAQNQLNIGGKLSKQEIIKKLLMFRDNIFCVDEMIFALEEYGLCFASKGEIDDKICRESGMIEINSGDGLIEYRLTEEQQNLEVNNESL